MLQSAVQFERDPKALASGFERVRATTRRLAEPLAPEDCVVQSMPEVSPTKWHLAHVSWFFETFLLKPHLPGYRPIHEEFEYLFNSYYNSVGPQFERPRRGLLSRPTVMQVRAYTEHVDAAMTELLGGGSLHDELQDLIELGLNHEQQHQELLLMDIKHVFSCNPLFPAYLPPAPADGEDPARLLAWIDHPGGRVRVGHDGPGFRYDNEQPAHRVHLEPFRLADRLVTQAEFEAFVADGGYRRAELWLADGWSMVCDRRWEAPLYWVRRDGPWMEYTLHGLRPLDPAAPVSHVSYYEADAYATWAGARLPREAEWEVLARKQPAQGNFLDDWRLAPRPAAADERQFFGDLWEWTASSYAPYPGYRSAEGAIGEYNGKFMCNQMVLRGGSYGSSAGHVRSTYRNFFYPHCRWQFGGIRLAADG